MRLEYISDTDYKLFVNSFFSYNINYDSKDELMDFIKDIMIKIRKMYDISLIGVYEVEMYVLKGIGIEFFFRRKDSYPFSNKVVDLKMIIHMEPSVYLKFDNYDYIEEYNDIKFDKDNYYLDTKELDDKSIIKLSDFYSVVYDKNINNYLSIRN